MSYTQLTEGQRYQIYSLKDTGQNQEEIARKVGVSPSTISRELRRNSGKRGYRPKQANEMALKRRQEVPKAIRMTKEMQARVTEYLNQEWSPEQISGYLRAKGGDWVSHETIYQFVLEDKKNGGTLYKQLRHSGKKRKKRYGGSDRRGEIKDRVSIDRNVSGEMRQNV